MIQREWVDFGFVHRIRPGRQESNFHMEDFALFHKVTNFQSTKCNWLCNGDEDLEQYEQFCHHSFAFREFLFLTIFRWESKCELDDFVFLLGTYGPTSPCVQRGRFAVIPEEPSSSPSVNDTNANERRTPSPDWDFAEVKWTNEKTDAFKFAPFSHPISIQRSTKSLCIWHQSNPNIYKIFYQFIGFSQIQEKTEFHRLEIESYKQRQQDFVNKTGVYLGENTRINENCSACFL